MDIVVDLGVLWNLEKHSTSCAYPDSTRDASRRTYTALLVGGAVELDLPTFRMEIQNTRTALRIG